MSVNAFDFLTEQVAQQAARLVKDGTCDTVEDALDPALRLIIAAVATMPERDVRDRFFASLGRAWDARKA